MNSVVETDRLKMYAISTEDHKEQFKHDVERGLSKDQKELSCIYFYDKKGSLLFEQICELPEYYLTRKETEILTKYAGEITNIFPDNPALVELGSGSSVKTRILIESFLKTHGEAIYNPIDISPSILEESSRKLLHDYPGLEIEAVAGRYEEGFEYLSFESFQPKLIFWLGSSIGNYDQSAAQGFLRKLSAIMSENDRLLIGMDMVKDLRVLEDAYDDGRGVTAEFNLNILRHINRELDADFNLENYRHISFYNALEKRIEMYLESRRHQKVYIKELDTTFEFHENETIHTENSHKYTSGDIRELVVMSDFMLEKQWFDDDKYFSLNLFKPVTGDDKELQ